ncbi:radical SAM protein [Gorillibacterium sp. sgz500922]|uniref:radical SAM protein n=1 Tax=Gorillibacterium sp. sgz500922 TaxID=3446694 RepID=UPI003F66B6B8
MKLSTLLQFSLFGLSTILFKRTKPILATLIVTDACNLQCKHCSVNNLTGVIHSYESLRDEMQSLYDEGIRILFFCGGETFLWTDRGRTLRDVVRAAKQIGYPIVNVVTNGTYPLELPEADLILLSLDGSRDLHNTIRGDTFDLILHNIDASPSSQICLYMAINQINQGEIEAVADMANQHPNIRAISFNFHTPYPETQALQLDAAQKTGCLSRIAALMDQGYPIFNLRSAFPYIAENRFATPCRQCLVSENGTRYICGRCSEVPGLCDNCGYFFAAEYSLVFGGNPRVIADMLFTYLKYI